MFNCVAMKAFAKHTTKAINSINNKRAHNANSLPHWFILSSESHQNELNPIPHDFNIVSETTNELTLDQLDFPEVISPMSLSPYCSCTLELLLSNLQHTR